MPGPPDSLFDWMVERHQDSAPALAAAFPSAEPVDRIRWRAVAAAVGLALAGLAAPLAVTALAATNLLLGPPLLATTLVALLVLAPAAVCLMTALYGMRGVAANLARTGYEAELAVLRVVVGTLLFGYALALAAVDCVPVTAAAVVAAWAILLFLVHSPVASPSRRNVVLALDAALFSAFLHFGGGVAAGWYPFYFLLILYAGYRFDLAGLTVSAVSGTLGFAAVIVSTEIWRAQPVLAGGLLVALAALPACFAGTIRALAAARTKATGAEAEHQTTLRLIADTLRGAATTPHGSRGAPPPIDDILDFAALEAGTFVPPIETFDLRAAIKSSLIPVQEKAAEKGIALRWRVDARLPYRLRGHAQALTRILAGLAEHALELAPTATTIRLAIDGAAIDRERVRLILRVDGLATQPDPEVPLDAAVLSLRLVRRLVAMVGGTFAIDRIAPQRVRLTVTLPLAIEEGTSARALDFGQRRVLIATDDDELARELAEPLAVWNADPRWPDDIDVALAELSRRGAAARPVLIVDGREKLLSALSLVHRVAAIGGNAPFVVLIAAEGQVASLADVEEAGLDGFIPAPVSERLLANALDALPLTPSPPTMAMAPAAPPPRVGDLPPRSPGDMAAATDGERVTPIAAHPKFAADAAAAVDARVIEGLRELGGGPAFLGELMETFRADARQVMQRLDTAVAAADAAGFARGLVALQRAAGPLGGTQLCDLLASLQGLAAGELRQRGATLVQRLEAEIERFLAALAEFVPAGEARQG